MDVQTMAGTAEQASDSTNYVETGESKELLLRHNQEVLAILATLEGLGVEDFICLVRIRDGLDHDYPVWPTFKKGTRLTVVHFEEVQRAQRMLGGLFTEAVLKAVADTPVEAHDLDAVFDVVVSGTDEPRGITAWITSLHAFHPDFDRRRILML